METKERKNTNTRQRRTNPGKGVDSLKMKFWGKKYDTQFTSTGKKTKYFMHDMQKITVDVPFTDMTAKKDINKYGDRAVATMYKEFTLL